MHNKQYKTSIRYSNKICKLFYNTYHNRPSNLLFAYVTGRSKFRCVVLLAIKRFPACIIRGCQSPFTLETPKIRKLLLRDDNALSKNNKIQAGRKKFPA